MKSSSLQSTEYATFYKPYVEALGDVILLDKIIDVFPKLFDEAFFGLNVFFDHFIL
jgi:hypothetical protein